MKLFPNLFRGSPQKEAKRADDVPLGEIVGELREEPGTDVVLASGSLPTWKFSLVEPAGANATALTFSESKKPVNRDLAMTLSAAYSCMDRISSAIAAMPFKIVRVVEGEEIAVDAHPAKYLLENSPNEWQTPFTLMRQFMLDALNGNGYIWIKRNSLMTKYVEFEYCDLNYVELTNLGKGRWVYEYTDEDGEYHVIQPYNMIHLRALGNRSRRGLSPVKLHASTIHMGLEMQKYGNSFFGAGGKPSGIVYQKGNLEERAWDRAVNNWNRASQQARDSTNKVVFLPNEVGYTPISISPVDAQLIQSMKLTKDDICGIYNVPAWMIGNTENTSYNNIEAMATAFVKNTLVPWLTNIEQEFTKKILIDDEIEAGYKIRADYSALLSGTPTEMLKYFGEASKYGFITRNEGRVGIKYRRDKTDETMNQFTVNVSQSKLTEGGEASLNDKPTKDKAENNEAE